MARNNSLNINRLSKYNFKYISIEEVLLLEYLISYYQREMLDIVVPNRIELETGLKRNKIVKAAEELAEKGFIEVKVLNLRTQYTLNLDTIIGKLNKLFVKDTKYAMQYFYYVQNPGAFNKSKSKKKGTVDRPTTKSDSKTDTKSKPKSKPKVEAIQTSLF